MAGDVMPRFRLMRPCRLNLTPEQEEPYRQHFLIEVNDPATLPAFVARHLDEEEAGPEEPPPEDDGDLLDDVLDIIEDILP